MVTWFNYFPIRAVANFHSRQDHHRLLRLASFNTLEEGLRYYVYAVLFCTLSGSTRRHSRSWTRTGCLFLDFALLLRRTVHGCPTGGSISRRWSWGQWWSDKPVRNESSTKVCFLGCLELMGRLDIEAAAAYAFPPLTGVALLILEHNNSYVRFHAWQVLPCERMSLIVVCYIIQWTHCMINSWCIWCIDSSHHSVILINPFMDVLRRGYRCNGVPGVWDPYNGVLIIDGMHTQIQILYSVLNYRSLDS